MSYKLVPLEPTPEMEAAYKNGDGTHVGLYRAMVEAAPDVPVGLEPVAYMAPTGTCVKAGYVSYTPNWTDYYTTPLVSQSAAAAVIAAKDAEIERLKEERLGVISQSNMHPSWLEKSREEILDCLRFQGRTTALLLAETADLRKQLSAAEKQRDELMEALEGLAYYVQPYKKAPPELVGFEVKQGDKSFAEAEAALNLPNLDSEVLNRRDAELLRLSADRLEVLEREHAEFFDRWHGERRMREKLVDDVERCYRMLLSEPNAKGALFKAGNILREALADAKAATHNA